MRRWLLCAGVACATQVHPTVAAEPATIADPGMLLVQSANASRTRNYQGVVMYRGDERFEVLRVQHRYKNDSERERLVSLTGEPTQVLRVDDRLICILPKGQQMAARRPNLKGFLAQLTADRVEQLKTYYAFTSEGEGRIAGRLCNGIKVQPKDGYRYGYEVWTDQETHLPLKVTLTGPKGQVLEQVMFTEVSFPKSIPDDAFETEVDVSKFELVTRNVPNLAKPLPIDPHVEPQVTLGKLPPGFKVVMHDDRPLRDGSGNVEHLLLSDGLSSVSVFSTVRAREERGLDGISHMGPVQAYGTTVGSFHVTVVGEVPGATIMMIGQNLRVPLPRPGDAAEALPAPLDTPTAQAITAPVEASDPR